jgi:hypothetical protein
MLTRNVLRLRCCRSRKGARSRRGVRARPQRLSARAEIRTRGKPRRGPPERGAPRNLRARTTVRPQRVARRFQDDSGERRFLAATVIFGAEFSPSTRSERKRRAIIARRRLCPKGNPQFECAAISSRIDVERNGDGLGDFSKISVPDWPSSGRSSRAAFSLARRRQ